MMQSHREEKTGRESKENQSQPKKERYSLYGEPTEDINKDNLLRRKQIEEQIERRMNESKTFKRNSLNEPYPQESSSPKFGHSRVKQHLFKA